MKLLLLPDSEASRAANGKSTRVPTSGRNGVLEHWSSLFWTYVSTVKERRSEVYGCLFTCMSTRACHLELVDDLSTDHFIMALKRFIEQRGRLQSIHSDNGTNFVGANYELRKCIKQLDEETI